MNRRETPPKARPDPHRLLNALPQPLLALDAFGAIIEVNTAAEQFFETGRAALLRSTLAAPAAVRLAGVRADRRRARLAVHRQRLPT